MKQYNWVEFPDVNPNEDGYYFTLHEDYGKFFYKAIYWNNLKKEWVHWRVKNENGNIINLDPPSVIRFIIESRADYYTECLDKLGV